jgi:hypothetical protein
MNWLNHSERWPDLRSIFMIVSVLAFVAAVYLARPLDRRRASIVVLSAWLLALSIGPWASLLVAGANYRLPQPHTLPTGIAFEAEHSRILLPTTPSGSPPEDSYQTFFVWTQRLGYVPRFSPTLEEALSREDKVLVVINPFRHFETAEIAAVERFVANGGRLLVMAGLSGNSQTPSPANELLAPFGMHVDARRQTNGEIRNTEGERQGWLHVGGVVTGGKPLLTLGGQAAVAAITQSGDGLVAVVATARPFSDSEMGSTATVPDDHQRFLYEIEFWLLRGLVRGSFPPFRLPVTANQ